MQGTQIDKHQTHRVESRTQESTRSEDQQRKHDPYVMMVGPLTPVIRYFVTQCQLVEPQHHNVENRTYATSQRPDSLFGNSNSIG